MLCRDTHTPQDAPVLQERRAEGGPGLYPHPWVMGEVTPTGLVAPVALSPQSSGHASRGQPKAAARASPRAAAATQLHCFGVPGEPMVVFSQEKLNSGIKTGTRFSSKSSGEVQALGSPEPSSSTTAQQRPGEKMGFQGDGQLAPVAVSRPGRPAGSGCPEEER